MCQATPGASRFSTSCQSQTLPSVTTAFRAGPAQKIVFFSTRCCRSPGTPHGHPTSQYSENEFRHHLPLSSGPRAFPVFPGPCSQPLHRRAGCLRVMLASHQGLESGIYGHTCKRSKAGVISLTAALPEAVSYSVDIPAESEELILGVVSGSGAAAFASSGLTSLAVCVRAPLLSAQPHPRLHACPPACLSDSLVCACVLSRLVRESVGRSAGRPFRLPACLCLPARPIQVHLFMRKHFCLFIWLPVSFCQSVCPSACLLAWLLLCLCGLLRGCCKRGAGPLQAPMGKDRSKRNIPFLPWRLPAQVRCGVGPAGSYEHPPHSLQAAARNRCWSAVSHVEQGPSPMYDSTRPLDAHARHFLWQSMLMPNRDGAGWRCV